MADACCFYVIVSGGRRDEARGWVSPCNRYSVPNYHSSVMSSVSNTVVLQCWLGDR